MTAMNHKKLYVSGMAALALCLAPGQSHAFWNWFKNCCGCGRAAVPVAAAPVAVAPAVASCDPCQQTVAYIPQTSYRVQYVSTPVTAYQPVAACGACGTTTTAYMPVTTYQTQAQVVPYTSYRVAYAALPVATTSYYTPAASCCSPSTSAYGSSYVSSPSTTSYSVSSYAAPATTTYAAPSATTYPAPTYSSPTYSAPTYSAPAATTAPALPSTSVPPAAPSIPQGTTPRTYAEPESSPTSPAPSPSSQGPSLPQTQPSTEERLRPMPDSNTGYPNPSTGPALAPPGSRMTRFQDDRWATAPAKPAARQLAARPVSETTIRPLLDDGLWRPAH